MKKIKLLSICLSACLLVLAQNDKQVIMNTSVSLRSMLGEDHERVELSTDDTRRADSLVNLYLPANYRHYDWSRKIENYYDYYRQYAGYKESPSANTIIFINGFYRKEFAGDSNSDQQFVSVKGGGSGYFRVKVDLRQKKCFDLSVNASR